jgi:hypothetical protein
MASNRWPAWLSGCVAASALNCCYTLAGVALQQAHKIMALLARPSAAHVSCFDSLHQHG